MPFTANAVQVLIASPGDVLQERDLIEQVIARWNALHAREISVVLLPVRWERHAVPMLGDRPQALINKQLVEHSDILVGVFWTRLGTPTGEADSGTVEEVREFMDAGKPVLLYFARRPVAPQSVDSDQLDGVRRFEEEIRGHGLIDEYEDLEAFTSKVDFGLTRVVHDRFGGQELTMLLETAQGGQRPLPAHVRARATSEEKNRVDSKQRIQVRTNYYIELMNEGGSPAYNVDFDLIPNGDDRTPRVVKEIIPVLGPGDTVRFPMIVAMGMGRMWAIETSWLTEEEGTDRRSARQTVTL